jgi:hypothetical protein
MDKPLFEHAFKKVKPESTASLDMVNFWRQKHNDMINLANARRLHLLNLQDKLNEYAQSTASMPDDENSNKEIKVLENKVDNLMIKFNEAVSVRNKYEAQVQNFKADRLHYDKQIIQFDAQLKAKEVEYQKFSEELIKAQKAKQELQNKYREYEARREEASRNREVFLNDIKRKEEATTEAKRIDMRRMRSNEAQKADKNVGLNLAGPKGSELNGSDDPYFKIIKEIEGMESELERIKGITGAKDSLLISQRNHSEVRHARRDPDQSPNSQGQPPEEN